MIRPGAPSNAAASPFPAILSESARPGRSDERQIHPLSDGARDLREVGRLSVGWIRIELEVSGVEDPRAPGLHEEGRGIGN